MRRASSDLTGIVARDKVVMKKAVSLRAPLKSSRPSTSGILLDRKGHVAGRGTSFAPLAQ